jgi:hypothetical protein
MLKKAFGVVDDVVQRNAFSEDLHFMVLKPDQGRNLGDVGLRRSREALFLLALGSTEPTTEMSHEDTPLVVRMGFVAGFVAIAASGDAFKFMATGAGHVH